MMSLPPFELAQPKSVNEAVRLLAEAKGEGRALAGGTDLLVHLKQRLFRPRVIVAVGGLAELRGVNEAEDGTIRIGAGEHLEDLRTHELVRAQAPVLAQACARVAHPQARVMGTLGGNLCIDVRCRYVNRTAAWRSALGGCLKADGDRCHVVPGGRRCVAALCGDTVAPLVALGAEVEVTGAAGPRRLGVAELRSKDGCRPLTLGESEIITAVRIPKGPDLRRAAYHKWAVRQAVDFPLVSVAMVCDQDPTGRLEDLRIAVSVLGPRPKLVGGLDTYRGDRPGPATVDEVVRRVAEQCVPLGNVLYDAAYRRRLLATLVRRQLRMWFG